MKKTICIDFDGVCNLYTGWKGEDELFEPRANLGDFLSTILNNGYKIAIFSTRPPDKLKNWFYKYFPWTESLGDDFFFPDKKPPANCYIDDRAVRFDGSFEKILDVTLNFKTFWEEKTLKEAVNSSGKVSGA